MSVPEGLRAYKRKERHLYQKSRAGFAAFFRSALNIVPSLFRKGRRKVSIVVMPQSGTPSRRIHLSRFALGLLSAAFVSFMALALFSLTRYGYVLARLESAKRDLAASREALDAVRDRTEALAGSTLKLETSLARLQAIAAENDAREKTSSGTDALKAAGLYALLNMPASYRLAGREIQRLDGLAEYFESAAPALDSLLAKLSGQKDIMSEIPNIWPIKGGIGHISMYFGQNENPFSDGVWYLHNGIDISTFRTGDAILAAADGKVIDASYEGSLGNCVTIQHSHGFLTRYGHLRSFKVAKGQQVAQGQTIGVLGNSGLTTGPHLHYEVHLGTSVIDPLRFLNISRAVAPER